MKRSGEISYKFFKVNEYIYRGERPSWEGILQLAKLGIRSIMNLERGLFYEEPDYVRQERLITEELGLRFLHLPLHPIKSPTIAEVRNALGLLTRQDNHPIFVHCERGNDRTGIVIAAFRIKVEGWDFERAINEMKSFGHRSRLLFWWTNVLLLIKNHDHSKF